MERECGKCGSGVKENWQFCPSCANPLNNKSREESFKKIAFESICCNWTEQERIGSGSFGVVFQGVLHGSKVAIKKNKVATKQKQTLPH